MEFSRSFRLSSSPSTICWVKACVEGKTFHSDSEFFEGKCTRDIFIILFEKSWENLRWSEAKNLSPHQEKVPPAVPTSLWEFEKGKTRSTFFPSTTNSIRPANFFSADLFRFIMQNSTRCQGPSVECLIEMSALIALSPSYTSTCKACRVHSQIIKSSTSIMHPQIRVRFHRRVINHSIGFLFAEGKRSVIWKCCR